MEDFEKLLNPEMKEVMNEMSTKFADAYKDTIEPGLGGMMAAVTKIMKDEPDLIQNSLNKISESSGNLSEKIDIPKLMQMGMETFNTGLQTFNALGKPAGSEESNNVSGTIAAAPKYNEKQVLLPATAKEVEEGKKKKFRITLNDVKHTFSLELEPGVYAYQFWHREEKEEDSTLIRVVVQEIVSDSD